MDNTTVKARQSIWRNWLKVLFLILFVDITIGIEFKQFIAAHQKVLSGVVDSITTDSEIPCIFKCEEMSDCHSISFSDTKAECLLHDKHPLQEGAIVSNSLEYDLYYHADCPNGTYYFRRKCYLFSTDLGTWNDAGSVCRTNGGNLVKIETAEEEHFVQSTAESFPSGFSHYWIGSYYSQSHASFLWYDHSPIEYEGWVMSNLQASSGHCLCFSYNLSWRWNDFNLCAAFLGYVCEIDLIIK